MPHYDVFCSFDVTHVGRFLVIAPTFDVALAVARQQVASGQVAFREPPADGARNVSVFGLKEAGKPVVLVRPSDDLDASAAAPALLAALTATSSLLAQLVDSLEELDAYQPHLAQLTANVAVLGRVDLLSALASGELAAERFVQEVAGWPRAPLTGPDT